MLVEIVQSVAKLYGEAILMLLEVVGRVMPSWLSQRLAL
jgi:hypothetical protein